MSLSQGALLTICQGGTVEAPNLQVTKIRPHFISFSHKIVRRNRSNFGVFIAGFEHEKNRRRLGKVPLADL